MGHRLSQPEKPGCVSRVGFFSRQVACYNPEHDEEKGDDNGKPPAESTVMRLTIGSNEAIAMGGTLPGIALFDEFGTRLGQARSTSQKTAPGGFIDVLITHQKGMETVRPSYALLQGGEEAICIASIALTYPDGTHQFLTGDDLSMCSRFASDQSRSFVDPSNNQPRCIWLQDSKKGVKGFQRVSFHLPDLIPTNYRKAAYQKNPNLLCRDTPRLWDFGPPGYGEPDAISYPIAIFNPLLEYDPETKFDKNPERVLQWQWDGKDMKDMSDQNPFVPRTERKREQRPGVKSETNNRQAGVYQITRNGTQPFIETRIEGERVRDHDPALVVSKNDVSAQAQCLQGSWNHTDYVSLREQIYCDMQSKTMFWTCNGTRNENCWNPESRSLQGFGTVRDHLNLNLLASPSNWTATGPLIGFTYSDISLIA